MGWKNKNILFISCGIQSNETFSEERYTAFILCYFYLGAVGRRLDNYLGGNPNPTPGQIYGSYGGYGTGYGYQYRRW
jgi:hypothetical protein